ncbi:hypothetical protein [Clostridium ganghwense]|uniref:Uncharacterized protein n=1 Tax=Clostridium ganghwense TaxID=312089 RepID=A0ABT4CU48_9CLOT|nr:hypothetical protein [Clostridium ganghwense]MCY6372595.1 hypothetical protein [Clostridium ganghwense]
MNNSINDFLKSKGIYSLKINGQVVLHQNNLYNTALTNKSSNKNTKTNIK